MKTELLHIFMIDFSKGWGVRPHEHDFYQIWYVLDGKTTYILDSEEVTIAKGDLIFIQPGTRHELPLMQDQKILRYVDVKFLIKDEDLQRECRRLPRMVRLNNKYINDSILKCREYWYGQNSYSKELAQLRLEETILLLVQMQSLGKKSEQVWLPGEKMENLQGVAADIAHYIDNHYAESFDLEALAEALRYNKAYLCKLFKEASGMTINNYLNYIRISRAYDLICYTSYSMSQICTMTGFSSVHYFTRTFKRVCGMPPSQIRELQKDSILRDIRLHGTFNYRYYVNPASAKNGAEEDA